MRAQIVPSWPMVFAGLLLTGSYFVAASLIFPDNPDEDHDTHFAENYRMVLAGFLLCDCALLCWLISDSGMTGLIGLRQFVLFWQLVPVTLLAIETKDRRIVLGCIVWLIALYPLSLVWT